jgi:hypothetical protein
MPSLAGRPLRKLFSGDDVAHVHAVCGLLSLCHIAARCAHFARARTFGFTADWVTPACMLPHAVLAATSLRFALPARRNTAAPMFWPEGRAHSIIFSARSLVVMLLGWLALRAPPGSRATAALLLARGPVVLLTQAAADAATSHFHARGQHNGSTIRGMPFPKGTPPRLRRALTAWYAASQLLASCMFLAYRLDTAFAVLSVVQLAAFGFTLCRKGLLSCAGWHAAYAALLAAVLAQHLFAAPVVVESDVATQPGRQAVARAPELAFLVPVMAVVAAARWRLGVSKYALWGAVIAAHAAAMRFAKTLDVVCV